MRKEDIIEYFENRKDWKYEIDNDLDYSLLFYKSVGINEDEQITVEVRFDDRDYVHNIVFTHSNFCEDEELIISGENIYLLNRVINILETDQISLKKHILKSYLKASERFEQIYYPVLKELSFTPWLDEIAGAIDYGSDSVFTYRFSYKLNIKNSISKLCIGAQDFKYNYIEDTIFWENEDLFILTKEEFYEKLVKNLKNDSSTSFLFSTDPKHTANSRYYVLSLIDCIDDYKRNKKPSKLEEIIDFNQIPDSYKHILEEYNYYKFLYEENNAAIKEKG